MEKGLLLDVGRKFWPLADLRALLELMAELGMTQLQFHFSELTGFRIESLQYPGLASSQHYRQAEIRKLLVEAAALGIEIVPSLDSPGHLSHVLNKFRGYALPMRGGNGEIARDMRALDVTNPEAREFMFSLYAEFADLFVDSQYFHIGGDEFIDFSRLIDYPYLVEAAQAQYGSAASGLEPYVDYVNDLVDFLSRRRKICRIWNDGFFRSAPKSLVPLTRQVEVCYWTSWDPDMARVDIWLEKGYTVLNYCDNHLYYVLGEAAGYRYPTVADLADFEPYQFSGQQRVVGAARKQVKGCVFSVWADEPEDKTSAEVLADLRRLLPVFVEKLEGKNE